MSDLHWGVNGRAGALREILLELSLDKSTAVLVAQHMPGGFTSALADRLDASTEYTVKEAVAGERLIGGVVYIAPGDYHLRLVKRRLSYSMELVMARRDDLCVPSVNELFTSVAETFDGPILGVVLTGMGNDGGEGAGFGESRGEDFRRSSGNRGGLWYA